VGTELFASALNPIQQGLKPEAQPPETGIPVTPQRLIQYNKDWNTANDRRRGNCQGLSA